MTVDTNRMNKNCLLKSRRCIALLLILNSTPFVAAADAGAAKPIIDPLKLNVNTLRFLKENKQRQSEAATTWKTFHDFQFADRYEESGIRFENHVVDDAGKNYKAVHYDHGNGMAEVVGERGRLCENSFFKSR